MHLQRLANILVQTEILRRSQWRTVTAQTRDYSQVLDELQKQPAWWKSSEPAITDYQRRRIAAAELNRLRDLDRELRVNNFLIVDELGAGGMGTVHKAWSLEFDEFVAIKRLSSTDHILRDRFDREARILRLLDSPLIARYVAYEPIEDGDGFLLAMECVDATTLREHMKQTTRVSVDDVIRWGIGILQALGHAHERSVVHRDVSPRNIMILRGDASLPIKLLDFGLARTTDALSRVHNIPDFHLDLTGTGAAIGTPQYMSPELWNDAAKVTGASDIYSVGCNLFEMLAGRPPFADTQYAALCIKHTQERPPDILTFRPDVSSGLRQAIHRMLAKSPEARGSTEELIRLLQDKSGPAISIPAPEKAEEHVSAQRAWPDLSSGQRISPRPGDPPPAALNDPRRARLHPTVTWMRSMIPPSPLTSASRSVDPEITPVDLLNWLYKPAGLAFVGTSLLLVFALFSLLMKMF